MRKINTFDTTNTLKGIAISAVLINHYLNLNVSGDNKGYANFWVSVFFIFSGYGIFYSLNHLFDQKIDLKKLFQFYYNRLIRIFPLLWIAWFIEFIVRGGDLSLLIPLGIGPSGHYWFIPALLQCYLVAPFIYFVIQNNSLISFLILIFAFCIINYIFLNFNVPPIVIKLANFWKWKKIIFLHISLFIFGYFLALYESSKSPMVKTDSKVHSFFFWCLIIIILAFMIIIKHASIHFIALEIYFETFPLIPIALLCLYSMRILFTNRFFGFLGRISFSIYLFHISFYLLLSNIGRFPENSIKELALTILLFPFFIYICFYLDRFGGFMTQKLKILGLRPTEKIKYPNYPH